MGTGAPTPSLLPPQASCLGSGSGLVRGLLGGLMGGARALVGGGIMGGGAGGAAHPGDFGVLLVFVVGGISWQEVREVSMWRVRREQRARAHQAVCL